MQARYVADTELETLLDPESPPWRSQTPASIPLMGTPLGLQPTDAIRVGWMGRTIGAITQVAVSAVHNGATLAFRLEWQDATENGSLGDTTSFLDAAAVALPASENAPLVVMGAPGAPVNAWHWRADEPEGARQVSAEGLGTTRALGGGHVRARGTWKEGRWRVVIARALQIPGEAGAAQLQPGQLTGFGVALWEGSRQERAGLKAFSGDWLPLQLEPATAYRRS